MTDIIQGGLLPTAAKTLRGNSLVYSTGQTGTSAVINSYSYDLLNGRGGHAMVEYNGAAIIFGGRVNNVIGVVNDLYKVDLTTGVMTALPNASPPSARTEMAYTKVGTTLIIFGGIDGAGTILGDIYGYDLVAQTWSTLANASAPIARYGATAQASATAMYMYGGRTSAVSAVASASLQMWRYTLSTQTWTSMTNGPQRRYRCSSTIVGNLMYISCGATGQDAPQNEFFNYSISGNSYNLLATASGPPAMIWHAIGTASSGTLIYAFGGSVTNATGTAQVASYLYTISSNTWAGATPIAIGRMAHRAIVYSGNIYYGGGYPTGGAANGGKKDIVTIITPTTIYNPSITVNLTNFTIEGVTFTVSVVSGNVYLTITTTGSNTVFNKTLTSLIVTAT